ncbi:hypothetical protein GW17_00012348, partial [Ensete ventricosum]
SVDSIVDSEVGSGWIELGRRCVWDDRVGFGCACFCFIADLGVIDRGQSFRSSSRERRRSAGGIWRLHGSLRLFLSEVRKFRAPGDQASDLSRSSALPRRFALPCPPHHLDLNPLYDVTIHTDYKEKYYRKLLPLGKKYFEVLKIELVWGFLFDGVDSLGAKTFLDYFPEYKCDSGTINQKRSVMGKSYEMRPWDLNGEFVDGINSRMYLCFLEDFILLPVATMILSCFKVICYYQPLHLAAVYAHLCLKRYKFGSLIFAGTDGRTSI